QLNALTIKYKFLIPLIEELINELQGSKYFKKLDLRRRNWSCTTTIGHPVAYYSKTLALRYQALPTYKKELLAVIQALDKWRGSENCAADALSRVPTSRQILQMILTIVTTNLLSRIVKSWEDDPVLQTIIQSTTTTDRISGICYWKKMRQDVKTFVASCGVCQRSKPGLAAYPGLLHPLPVLDLIWTGISMDFIDGLPLSNRKSDNLVVVDRLSKYSYFISLSHTCTAVQVANAFMDHVYKLYGLPQIIVNDRDKVFLSLF
nr:hypothetical protein [Tanacetum cinerariifolium]